MRLLCFLVALAVATLPIQSRAADPVTLYVIQPMSGRGAFLGQDTAKAIAAIQAQVNRTGGIGGRELRFVTEDSKSDPQVAVQIVSQLIAQHVPVILGPELAAECSAVMPMIAADGPVQYCLSNPIRPAPGSRVFSALFSTDDMFSVALRYFRERGWKRLAYMVSTDSTGQDAERALLAALAKPENKGIQVVEKQYFNPSDVGVAAQMTRIKAANPQVFIGWTTGAPAATLLRGEFDAGLHVPTMTSPGNLTIPTMKAWAQFLPADLVFPGSPPVIPDAVTNSVWRARLADLQSGLAAQGAVPDQVNATAWDPIELVISGLRKIGPDATAAQLQAYLEGVRGWVGVYGPYDMHAIPQRGIGENSVVMVHWDGAKEKFEAVSKLGGAPIPGR